MLRRMPHLQAVLQYCDQLLDLVVVQYPRRNAPLGCKPLEEIDPLRPFAIAGNPDWTLVGLYWNRKLVLGDKVECALRQSIVDLGENLVLLLSIECNGKLRQLILVGLVNRLIRFAK